MKKKSGKHLYENPYLLTFKMALGSALSWEISSLAGSGHPYLAPLSVILCLQSTIDQSLRFSFHRIIGTVLGVMVIVLLASHFHLNGWILGILILIGASLALFLRLDEKVLHQVALTILFVFVFEHKTKGYAIDRIRDTIIGSIVAVLIHMFLFPPNFTKEARHRIKNLRGDLTVNISSLANWLKNGEKPYDEYELGQELNKLLEGLHDAQYSLKKAENSLKWNPFSAKSKQALIKYSNELNQIQKGYFFLAYTQKILFNWSETRDNSLDEKNKCTILLYSVGQYFDGMDLNPREHLKRIKEALEKLNPETKKQRETNIYSVSIFQAAADLYKDLNKSLSLG
ncbi:FUSC family protein [Neobacillus terrae]|uniref:FUSC family protein n=1 Tax=Neobacillus terrae TaxID=3034837 RepID=UPI0014086A89|nr:FUSC family protein [Neobacillus terrae]NHM32549.1 FUSC family protein [Neobacillus terrae]